MQKAATRAVAFAVACLLAGGIAYTAVAASDAFVPKKYALLGGGVLGAQRTTTHADVSWVTIRVAKDGKSVHFYGDNLTGACSGGQAPISTAGDLSVPLRADGSFAGSGPIAKSAIADGTFQFKGKLSHLVVGGQKVEGATGTAQAEFTFHQDPSHPSTCKTPVIRWQARTNPKVTGSAVPRKGATYYGNNTDTSPVLIRVAPNGKQVVQAALEFVITCTSKKQLLQNDTVPTMTIKAGGTFSNTEAYDGNPQRVALDWGTGASAHYVATFKGKFGASSVGGSLNVVVTVTKNGSKIDSCTSSTTFAASL
jgi:hypothetical protein